MGGYRIPGPMCRVRNQAEIDEGTLALTCTPPPGVIGTRTLPYREATELHECIKILGEGNAAYCRREILGIRESLGSTRSSTSLRVGAVEVVFMPDNFRDDPDILGGKTRPSIDYISPGFHHVVNRVDRYTGPKEIRLIIQTTYKLGINPKDPSGYGRGTTSPDRSAGNTSLAFHEQCHGEDIVQYLKDHSLPKFEGRIGLTVSQFRQAIHDWSAALDMYLKDMNRFSEINTDCVGTTIDQYSKSKGINKTVCPVK